MPVDLHLVHGTHRKHRHGAVDDGPEATGRPIKPACVRGRAAVIWKEYRERAFWLSAVESHILAAWCLMTVELENGLDAMPAARIGQWRALASELGFPQARAMFGKERVKPEAKTNPQDPSAEFFDD